MASPPWPGYLPGGRSRNVTPASPGVVPGSGANPAPEAPVRPRKWAIRGRGEARGGCDDGADAGRSDYAANLTNLIASVREDSGDPTYRSSSARSSTSSSPTRSAYAPNSRPTVANTAGVDNRGYSRSAWSILPRIGAIRSHSVGASVG